MSTEHLTAEDRWFATNWEACGRIIAETVAAGRASSPYEIANVTTLSGETKASGWAENEPVHDADHGLTVSLRSAIPLTKITVMGDVGAENNRRDRVAQFAKVLVDNERSLFVASLCPDSARGWRSTGTLPISELAASPEKYDVLINQESQGGVVLAMLREALTDHLGGVVIEAPMGKDTPHLFVPCGSVTVHEAGSVRYRRPTSGAMRLDAVVGISCDRPADIVALQPDPT